MYKHIPVMTLLALFPVSAPAEAQIVMTLPVPHELVAWVETKTGVKLAQGQKITVVENDDPLFHGSDTLHASGDAAYLKGMIYFPIRSIVHFQEPAYQALAIHELVHATQDVNGRSYACTGQREAEAYSYQNQYLSEHGQFPAMASGKIDAMKSCKENF